VINENAKRAVTSRFYAEQLNPLLPLQSTYLEANPPEGATLLGTLSTGLCHVYNLLLKMGKEPQTTPNELRFAREHFCYRLREEFGLSERNFCDEEFVICKDWTVFIAKPVIATELETPKACVPSRTQWNSTAQAFNGRFIEDMM
jgi:hypothetical protein